VILPRAYGFIFSRVLVFFPFYGLAKFRDCIITRARIGVEIIYSTACLLVDMVEIGRNFAVSAFCFWVGVGIG